MRAGVVTATGCDGSLFGSVTTPCPGNSAFGSLSFGTSPKPFSPIVTTIVVPFSPGISTFVSLGYGFPSGFFGVTIASPFFSRVIFISTGVCVVATFGSVPFFFSSSSEIPSLSSSLSVTSGSPSPSVSR